MENILFLSGIDATTGMLEVSSADWTVRNCEFRDSVGQATDCVMVLDGSDRFHMESCKFFMAAAAGANSAISIGSRSVRTRTAGSPSGARVIGTRPT